MDTPLEITIYDEGKLAFRTALAGVTEFGRQNLDEPAPYAAHPSSGIVRIVIAPLAETTVPRKLLRVEPADPGRLKLTNLSRAALRLDVGAPLEPGTVRAVGLPVTVTLGGKSLALQAAGTAPSVGVLSSELLSLAGATFSPAGDPAASLLMATVARDRIAVDGTLDNEALLHWIQAALGVLQSAAGTTDFFRRAARALVDLVGLDFGCVLLREKDGWVLHQEGRAGHVRPTRPGAADALEWQPSHQVLDSVYRQKKTFWQKADSAPASESLVGIKSVVASPILSAQGAVIGVLYGERRRGGPGAGAISRIVAMLVEILAGSVAAGLARMEHEQAALRGRVLMEQFFTADLVRHLADNPDLLNGRDAEVTMLSCDIRGFSRICNNLGPTRTLEWVQNVLGTLSDCVLAERGVLVDYVGDELLAMWGAPESQPDHAQRACRAALAMLGAVADLNVRWLDTVKEPMGLSIGVSSGTARVGNVGSVRKFKYGALGNTVNLASRVQGATKFLKVSALITSAVEERLDATFRTRRLCQVKVVNIPDAVTLFQLTQASHADWDNLKDSYEQALTQFEKQEFRLAARILGTLLAQGAHRDDGPGLVLMQRAVTYLVDEPKHFTPVWELSGKGK